MENHNQSSASNATVNHNTSKIIFRSNNNKNSRPVSMSDTESQDFFYSPYPFDSPLEASNNPVHRDSNPSSMAVVPVSKIHSKKKKGLSQNLSYPATPPVPPPPPPAHVMMLNWAMDEGVSLGSVEDVGGAERQSRAAPHAGKSVWAVKVKQAALGFRICEVILCLMSFSIMAADKGQGWSGDSFYRYIEYRYLVGVNIIGCLHSGVQACDMAYCIVTGKHLIAYHLRYYVDFIIDQILAYLLMSASSSATTRLFDWISNWDKDAFTEMASASIWLSVMAFFAFAFSSLICGYSVYYSNYSN